jgi:hypothetical protein
MTIYRIQRSTEVTLSKTLTVDEVDTDAVGTVTWAVTRLNGDAVANGNAAHGATGVYSFALPEYAQVDIQRLVWTANLAGAIVSLEDVVEIVGGFLFGLGEARAKHKSLQSLTTFPPAMLAERRIEVEHECESICHQAWVPRFARVRLDGSGTNELIVPDLMVRTVRAASVAERYGAALVPLTSDQLAAVAPEPSGVLIRDDGAVWPRGHQNVIVDYEHGADRPPEDIHQNSMLRLRSVMGRTTSGIPDRVLSYSIADGGIYRIALPSATSTGIPDIDAAYKRHGHDRVWIS